MSKAEIFLFPGVTEVAVVDFGAVIDQQSDLLMRWRDLGSEFRRRLYNIPSDLSFELSELLWETSA